MELDDGEYINDGARDLIDLVIAIERQGGGAALEALTYLFRNYPDAIESVERARNGRLGREARDAWKQKAVR